MQFLNAVDPSDTNPYDLYCDGMDVFVSGGISFSHAAPDGSTYATKINVDDKSVNWMSWFDAARMTNWLENGQGSGSTERELYPTLVLG